MSSRLTVKQEKFAQLIFQGMPQRRAWGEAGYSTNYALAIADVHASRLANSDKVKLRVAELRNIAASPAIINEIRRKEILSEIAESRLGQFMDEKANPQLSKENLNNAGLAEVRKNKRGTTIKLRDPVPAIDLLNKMDGLYQPEGNRVYNEYKILIIREKQIEGGSANRD